MAENSNTSGLEFKIKQEEIEIVDIKTEEDDEENFNISGESNNAKELKETETDNAVEDAAESPEEIFEGVLTEVFVTPMKEELDENFSPAGRDPLEILTEQESAGDESEEQNATIPNEAWIKMEDSSQSDNEEGTEGFQTEYKKYQRGTGGGGVAPSSTSLPSKPGILIQKTLPQPFSEEESSFDDCAEILSEDEIKKIIDNAIEMSESSSSFALVRQSATAGTSSGYKMKGDISALPTNDKPCPSVLAVKSKPEGGPLRRKDVRSRRSTLAYEISMNKFEKEKLELSIEMCKAKLKMEEKIHKLHLQKLELQKLYWVEKVKRIKE